MSKRRRQVTIRRAIALEPMGAADIEAASRILAGLVARSYLADNPDLLIPHRRRDEPETGVDDARQDEPQNE